jgi:hypothetical protein
MWTLDECKGITLNSPNVLLNEMSPEEREKHMAQYKAGGPAGRPARGLFMHAASGQARLKLLRCEAVIRVWASLLKLTAL